MALNNTTFTALTTGTRDDTADKGAFYYLDGNATDGRLNISTNAVWQPGENTHIMINGNSNFSYMNGTIYATDLTYIAKPSGTGRVDFSAPTGGLNAHNLTYLYLGSGSIFNHLESLRNAFTGTTRFIVDMDSGNAFLQFASREYAGIEIDIKSTNSGVINLFPARSSAGFTSLPGFKTEGLASADTLILKKGTIGTSHGRLYDPLYVGATDNYIKLTTDSSTASNASKEYFTIDVTNLADTAKVMVTDGAGTVQYDKLLTTANCTIYANNGTTALVYYAGKKVIPCLVRSFTNTNVARQTISYKIREAGKLSSEAIDFAMNRGFVVSDLAVDEHYGTTATTLTLISTADELYDLARQAIASDLTLPDDLVTATNKVINIKAGWTLASTNGGSGDVLGINATTKIITAKLDDTGLQKTDKFNALSGTIDPSLDGDTTMNYIKSNGKVPVSLSFSSEAGTNSPVFGVWLKSQGVTNRAGILTAPATGLIDVTPNDVMYFVADAVNAYRSEPVEFTVGAFGSALTSSLRRIKKVDGTNLLPDALLVAQKRIADMYIYNQAAAVVDIKLPGNYLTDERWNNTTKTWTAKSEDFWPTAYKAEQLQSLEGSLIDPSVVIIDNFELSLSPASNLVFRQHADNPDCVINMNAFIIKRQGDTEQANTFVDHSNGVILVNAGSLIIADVITPAAALTAVVDAIPGKVNEATSIVELNENVIKASKLIPAG